MIACVYYAIPPHLLSMEFAILGLFRMSLSDRGPITPWKPRRCSVLAEVLSATPSLSLPSRVQAKFIFLGEFLDWPEENEQSRWEHGRAEVSQLQGSNLVTNFWRARTWLHRGFSSSFTPMSINMGVFVRMLFCLMQARPYVFWLNLCEIQRAGMGWTNSAKGRTAVQLHDGELGQMTGLLVKQSVFQIDDICDWSSGREKVVNRVKP